MQTIQLQNIATAIEVYYSTVELCNNDIKKLFGINSSSTIAKLKKQALEVMAKKGKRSWTTSAVDTECAFEAWGLDIKSLEQKYKKLQSYGMIKPQNIQGQA